MRFEINIFLKYTQVTCIFDSNVMAYNYNKLINLQGSKYTCISCNSRGFLATLMIRSVEIILTDPPV